MNALWVMVSGLLTWIALHEEVIPGRFEAMVVFLLMVIAFALFDITDKQTTRTEDNRP
jgi:hypothetical protein